MFRQLASSILLLIGLSASARADSFLWGGTTGSFSDPAAWSGPAPAIPGSPSQQLIFPLSTPPYTATIDLPWTLNNLVFTSNGGITLSAAPSAGLIFDGHNPTITQTGNIGGPPLDVAGITLDAPMTTTSGLTFDTGGYIVTGALTSTGAGAIIVTNGAAIVYQNNTPPTGFSQTLLDPASGGGNLTWNFAVPDSNPVSLSFGSGPISGSGSLIVNLMLPVEPTSIAATVSNPIAVQGTLILGGAASKVPPPSSYDPTWASNYGIALAALPPISSASLKFTGPISLGGALTLTSSLQYYPSLQPQITTIELSGTITLDQSNSNELDLETQTLSPPQTILISGNIVDDPNPAHTAGKPLVLSNTAEIDATSNFIISGRHNTFSTGTIIEYGDITLAPGSTLGTGPIAIQFGTLHLTSPSNINAGQTVLLQYDQGAILALDLDMLPYAFIDSASKGTLALDTTFTTPLDMSKLGDGQMFLGSTNGSSYIADSLRPGADHTYRLTGSLVIAKSVFADYDGIPSSVILSGGTLAAPNSYSGGTTANGGTAAASGALGTGNVTVGTFPGFADYANLYLTAPDTYSSAAIVNVFGTLSAVGANGSIPFSTTAPIFHPGSALVLGDGTSSNSDRYPDTMPLTLDGANLIVNGCGITNETIGALTVSRVATIILNNPSTGTNTTTLIAASVSRQNHGILFINPFQNASFTDSGSGDTANVELIAAPPVTNGMVAPWIQYRPFYYDNLNPEASSPVAPASFLSYGPGGFSLANYVPMPSGSGSGVEIVDVPSVSGDLSVSNDKSIYALRTFSNILNGSPNIPTLHIVSGGLIALSSSGFSPPAIVIQPNVDFANVEACINVQGATAFDDTSLLDIQGLVTANQGITKSGTGTLQLSNPADQIHGPIAILEGGITFASLPDATSADPIQLSDRGTLNFLNTTVLTRPVNIVATGDVSFLYGAGISSASGASLTIAAPITGHGNFGISSGGLLRIAAPITVDSVSLYASRIDLAANITASVVELQIGRQSVITGAGVISASDSVFFTEGILSPGENPGNLATMIFDTPSMNLADGATFDVDLDATGHSDRILVTGMLAIGGPIDPGDPTLLALNFLGTPTGQIYTIVSASEIDGTFDTVTGLPAGYAVEYTPSAILIAPSSSSNEAAVPEPSALGVFLAGGCTLLLLRRSRRTAAPKAY